MLDLKILELICTCFKYLSKYSELFIHWRFASLASRSSISPALGYTGTGFTAFGFATDPVPT